MTTIDDILEEKGFSSSEKSMFLDMLKQAKAFQKNMNLEQLKPYMNSQIDKLVEKYENSEN